jgi:hypothetical protein
MSQQFKIIQLNEQYASQAVTVLTKGFMQEPMQSVLDTTWDDISEFMEQVVQHTLPTGQSIVAIDLATDKVVAVSVNKDLLKAPIGGDFAFSDRLLPIFELLDQLDNQYHQHYTVAPNEVFHCFMMATDSDYRNKDISRLFFNRCAAIAQTNGFKTMLAEATGEISMYIINQKCGFEKLYSIKYADFEFNGTYPFKDLGNEACCYLLHRPVPTST